MPEAKPCVSLLLLNMVMGVSRVRGCGGLNGAFRFVVSRPGFNFLLTPIKDKEIIFAASLIDPLRGLGRQILADFRSKIFLQLQNSAVKLITIEKCDLFNYLP